MRSASYVSYLFFAVAVARKRTAGLVKGGGAAAAAAAPAAASAWQAVTHPETGQTYYYVSMLLCAPLLPPLASCSSPLVAPPRASPHLQNATTGETSWTLPS